MTQTKYISGNVLVEIYRRTFWELFQEELEAWWQLLLYGTGTGTPIGILHIKSQEGTKMLFTKRVKDMLLEEQLAFVDTYRQMVESMVATMEERGEGRDEETPIHFRRSPAANLEMIHSKYMRVESMLDALDHSEPDIKMLRKLRNESVDIANYALFNATVFEMLISEIENEEETIEEKMGGIWIPTPQEIQAEGDYSHTNRIDMPIVPTVANNESQLPMLHSAKYIGNNGYCSYTCRICPRTEGWGESVYCFGASMNCDKAWLPKERK